MAASQLGIKQLLDAETKAQEIVNNARKDKVNKLKQARDEAEREISQYKADEQRKYEGFEREHFAGTEGYNKQLEFQQTEQSRKIDADLKTNAAKVVELLVQLVGDVQYE
eukprot:TRINITY_DN1751_c0_g1_i2.p2 TRINITY_DN1751_c0_g1~~TRINITY_DN1751_c0_g1_i2.p2  ORF type:complete len:110 (-),score=27.63 TRINITY_DN1751_c0_g1_i2:40-369(-)